MLWDSWVDLLGRFFSAISATMAFISLELGHLQPASFRLSTTARLDYPEPLLRQDVHFVLNVKDVVKDIQKY